MPSGSGVLLIGLLLGAAIALWAIVAFIRGIRLIFIKGSIVLRPLLLDFEQTIADAEKRLLELEESEVRMKPGDGKWSRKETLGHLIDSASNNHQRFVRAQFGSELTFPDYAQSDWVTIQDYQNESWVSLVHFWVMYNRHLLHLLSVIPGENLKGHYFIGEEEPITLEELIREYVKHLKHHLRTILSESGPQRGTEGQ
ncbi:MAG TPA: DinB family protein [Bacteroidota bacterium]